MSKQEEIGEGIYNIIKETCESESGWIGNKGYTVDKILKYLDSHNIRRIVWTKDDVYYERLIDEP